MIAIMSSPGLHDLWDESAAERQLAAGEVLFRSGDTVRSIHRIAGGAVALIRPLPHGSDLIIQRAHAGTLLAEASIFAETYHCNAVALSPARVDSLPVTRVRAALRASPELAWSLAGYLAAELQKSRALTEIVSLKTVAARLDAWLGLTGETLPPKGRWRELAAVLGVTPEAFYRELAGRRSGNSEAGG